MYTSSRLSDTKRNNCAWHEGVIQAPFQRYYTGINNELFLSGIHLLTRSYGPFLRILQEFTSFNPENMILLHV